MKRFSYHLLQFLTRKEVVLVACFCLLTMILWGCDKQASEKIGQPVNADLQKKRIIESGLSEQRITYAKLQDMQVQEILRQYQEYADANPDYIGWLYMEDTMVNGPVVQSQLDGNGYWEYLYKDFYGNDKFAGTLFMDKACSIDEPATDNWLIYGHNMNDGSMFGTLKYYKEEAFWKEHPTFTLVTRNSVETFEILGVVQSWVSDESEGQFEYFYFFDAENEEEFNWYVQQVKENSLYETGVEASYGDQLITLSTCDSWHWEGRLAVIGRRYSVKKGL